MDGGEHSAHQEGAESFREDAQEENRETTIIKENLNESTTKESNDISQLKVCHICRKRDEGELSFKTCSNPDCKEAFCSECIEKICKENQMESELVESGNNNK